VDKVLNLSSFGDIIEDPNKDMEDYTFHAFKKNMTDFPAKAETSKVNQLTHIVLKDMAQIKLLHWQTYSYSEHKALDKLFGSFIDLTDDLLESVMGKYGRPELSNAECNIAIINYSEPQKPDGLPIFMSKLYKCYAENCKAMFEKDAEIINQIDEILSIIDKINYLLTLKK
tara:strand:- start:300 stop:812 length:513 start_codon:yes stop_codon:yes gene_type:complete